VRWLGGKSSGRETKSVGLLHSVLYLLHHPWPTWPPTLLASAHYIFPPTAISSAPPPIGVWVTMPCISLPLMKTLNWVETSGNHWQVTSICPNSPASAVSRFWSMNTPSHTETFEVNVSLHTYTTETSGQCGSRVAVMTYHEFSTSPNSYLILAY